MSLLFRDLSYSVYKSERLLEIREDKFPGDVVLVDHIPLRNLWLEGFEFRTLQRRYPSAAGYAGLAGEIFGHGWVLFYCGGSMST